MSFKKIIILTVCFLSVGTFGFAQNTPQDMVDTFFEKFEKKGMDKAIDYIFATNPWMSKKEDVVTTLKNQAAVSLTDNVVGKYYTHEAITAKTVGESLVYVSYMVKYDRQPVRFNFMFYKPDKEWRIHEFSYDDSIDEELEESGKAYRLPENL